jgi:hypothetical protein
VGAEPWLAGKRHRRKEDNVGIAGLALVIVVMLGIVGYLVGSLLKSIVDERRSSRVRKVWKHFGLSIAFCVLFFTSWVAQGVVEWQVFVDQQRAHREDVRVVDYLQEFSQSTLENWQSEFLQLFSFVVMSALLIHRGSAESKDSDERMQQSLQRIEERLEELRKGGRGG